MQYSSLFAIVVMILCVPALSKAQSLIGTSGLYHIPTARIYPDKSLVIGLHQLPPQYSLYGRGIHNNRYGYATITFLPRVELMFRYTNMMGVEKFSDRGPFMDRMVAFRLLLFKESRKLPAILFGIHDPVSPNSNELDKYFGANYVVSTKALKYENIIFDTSVGFAFDLPYQKTQVYKGLFGGFSLSMEEYSWMEWMLEYDSNRWNTGAKVRILNRVQIMAGLMEFKRPAGGISYRFQF